MFSPTSQPPGEEAIKASAPQHRSSAAGAAHLRWFQHRAPGMGPPVGPEPPTAGYRRSARRGGKSSPEPTAADVEEGEGCFRQVSRGGNTKK